ncbi:DUF3788 domain-containing protein [Paraburkholderia nodosa]|uniref:DUF3788 domain-containing protein n=1 Tax=Paraburkholderia nodosa TaxID=392320 RepID=UPI0008412DF0|nr:DUF3788 domain-containing protein [Paraburkholderia nodosa]
MESKTARSAEIGDRISDKSSHPDERTLRDWLGPEAFEHWGELRSWIDEFYPNVFTPDWIYGGKKRGWALRYKENRAFCSLFPAYRLLSVLVVLGRAEREKFEERRYFWSPPLVKQYDESRTYHDGKWMTIPILSVDDRVEVTDLMRMKRPTLTPFRGS